MRSRAASAPPKPIFEAVLVLLALLLVTDALTFVFVRNLGSDINPTTQGSPLRIAVALAIYVTGILIAVGLALRDTLRLLANPLVLLTALYPLLSVLWSAEPDVAFRRAVAHALTVGFCIYLAVRIAPERLLRLFLVAALIGGVGSLALIVAVPSLGVQSSGPNAGTWHGLYGHKAIVGRVGALAIAAALFYRPRAPGELLMKVLVIAIFAVLLYMSGSRAGWLLAGIGIAAWGLIRFAQNRGLSVAVKGIAFASALATGVALAVLLQPVIFEAVGRDATLSGRESLWEGAIEAGMTAHPWQGAGYRSFWTPTGMNAVLPYIGHWGARPGHGHNGYMDTWLEMGIVGAVLLGVLLTAVVVAGLVCVLDRRKDPALGAYMAFAAMFCLNNYVATVAFEHTDIAWMMVILGGLYFQRALAAPAPTPAAVTARSWQEVRARVSL